MFFVILKVFFRWRKWLLRACKGVWLFKFTFGSVHR